MKTIAREIPGIVTVVCHNYCSHQAFKSKDFFAYYAAKNFMACAFYSAARGTVNTQTVF